MGREKHSKSKLASQRLWTKEEVKEALVEPTGVLFAELLAALPPSAFGAQASALTASGGSTLRVVVLGLLSTEFCAGREPAWGEVLAQAAHEEARVQSQASPLSGIMPATLLTLADNHVRALGLLGKSIEVIAFADVYLNYYREQHNVTLLKLLRADALINLRRLDEADAALQDTALLRDAVNGLEALRLRRKLDEILVDATNVKKPAPLPQHPEVLDDGFALIKTMISEMSADPSALGLLEKLSALDPSHKVDATDAAQMRKISTALDEIQSRFLTKGGAISELTVGRDVRNATLLFHGKPRPEEIREAMATLKRSLEWATLAGKNELIQGALWGLYLCHNRLREPSKAADAVLALQGSLELTRKGIEDPMKRAGVFAQYPHLFKALCRMLLESRRHGELLEAIESSKGRVIVDRMSDKEAEPFDDTSIRAVVARLPELARRERFHYLTYFMDDECVYASFMSRDGTIHPVEAVAISAERVRAAEKEVNPREWGVPSLQDPRRVGIDVSREMAPLIGFLDGLMVAGVVRRDDVICYSPPVAFQNIPLQYLQFRDRRLIDFVQLVRFQSTFHLDMVLKKENIRPQKFLGVVVSARQDAGKRDFGAKLEEPLAVLAECGLEGDVLREKNATPAALRTTSLGQRIVHFSTHGYFPDEGTPFHDSFLFLAGEDGLSNLEMRSESERATHLSPSMILNQKMNFDGSHVSMMACVSGLAREGAGGDALGLDWALIQSGAASLISTHWPVSASKAAKFFTGFYKKWLVEKQSRAAAFRNTMLEMLGHEQPTPEQLRHAAAFSLTGEFR